jgi:hypothetical protein
MLPKINGESLVYAGLIILTLIILWLLIISPPDFLNNKIIYQGF